jgi:hypothetical protein
MIEWTHDEDGVAIGRLTKRASEVSQPLEGSQGEPRSGVGSEQSQPSEQSKRRLGWFGRRVVSASGEVSQPKSDSELSQQRSKPAAAAEPTKPAAK